MTPEQSLKAAMLGNAPAPGARPAKAPKRGRRAPKPRRSRAFRWGVKLLMLALMLMLSRGLLQTPEVRAMAGQARDAVTAFVQKERALQQAEAAEDAAPALMPASQVQIRRGTDMVPE